ncbi:MAG: hypothetical protein SVV03_00195 [Candidatus Nanohaloarchaea archaeon]|nr:hypothetical protein [Candidatus Nanohaloarchaea archaeon]
MPVTVGEAEKQILHQMVETGLFESEDEVVRASILKYASDMGLFDRGSLWRKIKNHKKRDISPDELKEELERLEDEI